MNKRARTGIGTGPGSGVKSGSGRMVVAVGGSAGGLEAARGLIAGLPAESGIAYILVQHLDPDHPSMLADLLRDATPFPVVEITDGMPLLPDRLHVIPSGSRISVAAGSLRLVPATQKQGPRLPIDFLLQSLAKESGLRVVAILLSGSGTDGAAGVRAVHAAGGFVMVQSPQEASHDGMPAAAIATGCADAILPVAAMGAAIVEFRNRRPVDTRAGSGQAVLVPAEPAPDWIAPVLALLKGAGHDFSGYKIGTMQRRIARRAAMAGHGGDALPAYVAQLERDADELQALANDLLINVTGFFRDEAVFETLAGEFLPDLVGNHSGDGPIRVWSAGCSSGEEAWSLAILVLEEIARSRPALKLQLFATDVDPDAIAAARHGVYPASIGAQVSEERLQRFFVADDAGWRVGPALQSSVVFAVHDLLTDPPFSRIDLIACRNLLIYLQPAAQARAISMFRFALRTGGLLLLGKAEAVTEPADASSPAFTRVSRRTHLYRRNPDPRSPLPGKAESQRSPAAQGAAAEAPDWALPILPSTRLQALEAELASIRAELADADLHPETGNAEQLAIYADTLSRNQEYQATNEELITSQEELQSLNEELAALNGQLQETIDRHRTTADDLQNILYSTDVATIFLDLDNNIRFFTPATRVLFNMLPSDIGRPFTDLAPRTPDPMLADDIARVRSSGQPVEREIDSTGGTCFSRRILSYRTHDKQVEGVVITYTDATERKQAAHVMQVAREVAEAANLAKSRFLAAASHDLRQPLQALVLLQALLLRNCPDPDSAQLLGRLDRTLVSMASMLDGLLDINRIEAGAVVAEPGRFALDALLAETVQGHALQAAARGLKLRHVQTRHSIVSDRRLLAGMLQNLVDNALKYTRRGGVLVGARRRGQQVLLEVWDSGIGIPEAEIEAIFEPYHQVGPARENSSRGLGLGLSIVRGLGDLLGHDVSARSRPGHGSVFRIRVPLAEPLIGTLSVGLPEPATVPRPAPAAVSAARILVVDDDRDLLDLLGQILQGGGHTVVPASDAAGAMAAIRDQPPDLVVSDFRLQGPQDGLELAQLLRETLLETAGRALPVIMLTGDISIEALERLATIDCVRLSKPVRPAVLLAAIDAALGQSPPAADEPVPAQGVAAHSIVHVIDDDPVLLGELGVLLADAGLAVRLHGSSEAFRANWVPAEAGCLLIDAALPGESGLALMHALKAAGTLPPSIVITGHGDVAMAVEAMQVGALDFIEKPARGPAIIASIRRALASGQARAAGDEERREARGRLKSLTPRQVEVMKLVLEGHPSKNIAADLKLSQRTVENHRAEIMQRTGCRSLPELVRLVMAADQNDQPEG